MKYQKAAASCKAETQWQEHHPSLHQERKERERERKAGISLYNISPFNLLNRVQLATVLH